MNAATQEGTSASPAGLLHDEAPRTRRPPPAVAALTALALAGAAAVIFTSLHLLGGTGMGDVKLVTVAALATGVHGPGAWVLAILASYVLAALFGAVPALLRGQRKTRVPMAPYLVAGHVLALLAVLGYLAS